MVSALQIRVEQATGVSQYGVIYLWARREDKCLFYLYTVYKMFRPFHLSSPYEWEVLGTSLEGSQEVNFADS